MEPTSPDPRIRLFERIEGEIKYALVQYGGFTDGGGCRDEERWRSAPLTDLMTAVMLHLRAGLGPALSHEAVEAGVDWIRTNVPQKYIDAAIRAAQGEGE